MCMLLPTADTSQHGAPAGNLCSCAVCRADGELGTQPMLRPGTGRLLLHGLRACTRESQGVDPTPCLSHYTSGPAEMVTALQALGPSTCQTPCAVPGAPCWPVAPLR